MARLNIWNSESFLIWLYVADLKNFVIKVPCDLLTFKRRVAKLLYRSNLHGVIERKRLVDEQGHVFFFTEIIVRGTPRAVTQLVEFLKAMITKLIGTSIFSISATIDHDILDPQNVRIQETGILLLLVYLLLVLY